MLLLPGLGGECVCAFVYERGSAKQLRIPAVCTCVFVWQRESEQEEHMAEVGIVVCEH